jgi:hypothetical protein
MIRKRPLIIDRIRKIEGSFATIEHRFLRSGFWVELSHYELLLYLFLVIVADRQGLSFYSYDKICSLLAISVDEYIMARDGLIDQELIAFDGQLFQVLSLPVAPKSRRRSPLINHEDMRRSDPATIRQILATSFGGSHD